MKRSIIIFLLCVSVIGIQPGVSNALGKETNLVKTINIGPKRTFADSDTKPGDIDTLFENLQNNKIAIYFHGGMVPRDDGYDSARRVNPCLEGGGAHPISFVWETGLKSILEEIKDKMIEKLKETFGKEDKPLVPLFKVLGVELAENNKIAVQFDDEFVKKELEKKEGEPFADFQPAQETRSGLEKMNDEQLRHYLEKRFRGELKNREYADKNKSEKGKLASWLVDMGARILKRAFAKTFHGLYPTFIEELIRKYGIHHFLRPFWDSIKNRADQIWKNDKERYVGPYFLEKLNRFAEKKDDRGEKVIIDLIGHSTGSIAIIRLLSAIEKYEHIKIRNIIFLAPACRCDLFSKEIIDKTGRFGHFRMFTMGDKCEKKDVLFSSQGIVRVLVSMLYPRSLLYFISGVLEIETDAAILGMHRHIKGKRSKKVHDFLYKKGKGRVVFSKTKDSFPTGCRSYAKKHTGFNRESETLKSLTTIIKNGLQNTPCRNPGDQKPGCK